MLLMFLAGERFYLGVVAAGFLICYPSTSEFVGASLFLLRAIKS